MKKIDKSTPTLITLFVVTAVMIIIALALIFKNHDDGKKATQISQQSIEIQTILGQLSSQIYFAELERNRPKIRKNILSKRERESRKLISILETKITQYRVELYNSQQLSSYVEDYFVHTRKYVEKLPRLSEEEKKAESAKIFKIFKTCEQEIFDIYNKEGAFQIHQYKIYLKKQEKTPYYIIGFAIVSFSLLVFAFIYFLKKFHTQKKINNHLNLSLQTMKLAQETGQYGVWRMGINHDEFYFSENLYRIIGYSPNSGKPTFKKILESIHPEDIELFKDKISIIDQKGEITPFRYRVFCADGSIIYLQTIAKTHSNPQGEKYIIGITTDVTKEVEYQLDIEHTNKILMDKNKHLTIMNEIFEEAAQIGKFGTWQWFDKGNIFQFSDNIKKLYGIPTTNDTIKLEDILQCTLPEDKPLLNRKINKMFGHTPTLPFVYRIKRKTDGVTRFLSVNSKFIEDPIIGNHLMVIVRDVTLDEQRQRKLEENNKTLEENNKELQAFNYAASHDLQEPLRKIETFISRIDDKEKNNLSESGQLYLGKIIFSVKRMRKLIDDLLQFSRNTKIEQNLATVDLNEILENTKEELQTNIKNKKARIYAKKLPKICGVEFQIQQLFINLIGNSIKYSHPNRTPKIIIKTEVIEIPIEQASETLAAGKYQKITLQDNGIGFDPKYAERIFSLFNRLHGKLEYEGTGIGLAICKKIVENHKGKIWAEGKTDKGAKFIVIIPK